MSSTPALYYVVLLSCQFGCFLLFSGVVSLGERASMSSEKFFCVVKAWFLFVFWVLLLVLVGVCGSVGWCFCALSMLLSVTFDVG